MLFLPTQKAQLYVFYTQRYCSFVSCAVVLRKQKKIEKNSNKRKLLLFLQQAIPEKPIE
jgi:hypothetical protein